MKNNNFILFCFLILVAMPSSSQVYTLYSGHVQFLFDGTKMDAKEDRTPLSEDYIVYADKNFEVQSTKTKKVYQCPPTPKEGEKLKTLISIGFAENTVKIGTGIVRGEKIELDNFVAQSLSGNSIVNFHYLLIGVYDFKDPHWEDFPNAEGYIDSLSKAINERMVPDNNFVLSSYRKSVNSKETTKEAILSSLQSLSDSIKPYNDDNLVMIYLSSHGVIDKTGKFHLIASDTRFDSTSSSIIHNSIDADALNACIKQLTAKGAKVLLFVDACYSGALAVNAGTMEGSSVYFMSTEDDLNSGSDTIMGSSFVYALTNCISGKEQIYFRNTDNNVTPRSLQDYLSQCVQNGSNEQRPTSRRFNYDINQTLWKIKSSNNIQLDNLIYLSSQGNTEAIVTLGDIYMDPAKAKKYNVEQDVEKALDYYRFAYMERDSLAAYRLGLYYYHSSIPDYDKAFKFFKVSADNGYYLGVYYLCVCYAKGHGTKKSTCNAKKTLKKIPTIDLAEINKVFAKEHVFYPITVDGEFYNKFKFNGRWVVANYYVSSPEDRINKPERYTHEVMLWANSNDPKIAKETQAELGDIYNFGLYNNNVDYEKAFIWYNKSAEQGCNRGYYGLGLLYMFGNGVEKNYQKAQEYFKIAAEKKLGRAYAAWGDICYKGGYGLEKDERKAVEFWQTAANMNDSWAQFRYGLCLLNGTHLKVDEKTAFQYFMKSAKQDFPVAQYMVGYCLYNGIGVNKDAAKALKWLTKAKNNGNEDAKSLIEEGYYVDGTVIER